MGSIKIKRALISVSDKTNLLPLVKALTSTGTIIYGSGGTRKAILEAGFPCLSVEEITKTPEAFQGRMKTLSFPLLSGILSRRGDASDLKDLSALNIQEIDAVVVNFYPFEKASPTATLSELTELIDIGGPTLVRAAAKNSDSVLVLTCPETYQPLIDEIQKSGAVTLETRKMYAQEAWTKIYQYDQAIEEKLCGKTQPLRYGENPHQKGKLRVDGNSPIQWDQPLGAAELSYNNVLDMSSAFYLAKELKDFLPHHASVVIVKHGNPCGVASVPKGSDPAAAQECALELAWAGDPVSAFGGVLVFTDPITEKVPQFLKQKFVEVILAPKAESASTEILAPFIQSKKNLKGAYIAHWNTAGQNPEEWKHITIPGGTLSHTRDQGLDTEFKSQSGEAWSPEKTKLAQFGILVGRALKSNAISVVYSPKPSVYQLAGAGQGQPNRVDALGKLAIPRARATVGEQLSECVLVSDAFFPFKDSIELAAELGIQWIVEPGGSIRDAEVIEAAKLLKVNLAFTGRRHFNH